MINSPLTTHHSLLTTHPTRTIIKKQGKHAPPIIAMTANVLSEDENEFTMAGMKDFVSKPFTFERLENVIQKWTSA